MCCLYACMHHHVIPQNLRSCNDFVLYTERQNLSCLQTLTLRITMAKIQRHERAWYVFQILYLHLLIIQSQHALGGRQWNTLDCFLDWNTACDSTAQSYDNTISHFNLPLNIFLPNRQSRKGRRRLETRPKVGQREGSLVLAGWMAIIRRMGWRIWPCSRWLKRGRVPHRWVHVLICSFFSSSCFSSYRLVLKIWAILLAQQPRHHL